MARLAARPPSHSQRDSEVLVDEVSSPSADTEDPSPSASQVSQTSDKENRLSGARATMSGQKRKSTEANIAASTSSGKRRRSGLPSQAIFQREVEARKDKDYYDPDQNPEERRAVRKGMRDLAKELNDSRSEFLQARSNGLYETLAEADKYFKNVKQTADATIDSRLLVTTADLSYKKTNQLVLGDAATGIDVDDFVSRCVAFMRRGPADGDISHSPGPSGTQRSQRRPARRDAGSEDDEDEGEDVAFNWSYLGSRACFPTNSRPCLSGFLLGPLSLQKRARVQSQRRARQQRINLADAVRATELTAEDIEATKESGNLTQICDSISKLLRKVQEEGQSKVEAEVDDDMDDQEVQTIMHEHGVSDDGGVPLMQFCVDPDSFGQTVENLFYVSFLIKEGAAGLNFDSRGLPTIHPHQPTAPQEARVKGVQRNQAVFAIDFETWEELVQTFNVKESLIPHREETNYDDGTMGTAVQL